MKLISGDRSLCSRLNLAAAGALEGAVQNGQAAVSSRVWLSSASAALVGTVSMEGKCIPANRTQALSFTAPLDLDALKRNV